MGLKAVYFLLQLVIVYLADIECSSVDPASLDRILAERELLISLKERTICYRDPFNRSISIINSLSNAREILPTSFSNDAFFSSLVQDPMTPNTLYFTTQSSIYSMNINTKAIKTIISGYVEIEISGFNLGTTKKDILSLSITDLSTQTNILNTERNKEKKECTSIIHLSPNYIRCKIVLRAPHPSTGEKSSFNTTGLIPESVEIVTNGGRTRGGFFAPGAQVVKQSGSGRPVISQVSFRVVTIVPTALSLAIHGDLNNPVRTLYWNNAASNEFTIQRSFIDGSQIETVVNNVQSVQDLHVNTVYYNTQMEFLSYNYETAIDITNNKNCSTNKNNQLTRYIEENIKQEISCHEKVILEGHMLFFTDLNQIGGGSFSKLHLLPISDAVRLENLEISSKTNLNINDISLSTVSLQDTNYYSVLVFQESSAIFPDILKPVTLLQGLKDVRNIAEDREKGFIYLTLRNGVLFKLSLSYLLEQVYVAENIVPTVELNALLRKEKNSVINLPNWIEYFILSGTNARFQGISLLPSVNNEGSKFGLKKGYQERRIIISDTNQQQFFFPTENGFFPKKVDIGSKFGVFWPHQVLYSISSENTNVFEVFVSEILGRIWKFKITKTSEGFANLENIAPPDLLLDWSSFPASNKIRQFLIKARNEGTLPYDSLFYEINV